MRFTVVFLLLAAGILPEGVLAGAQNLEDPTGTVFSVSATKSVTDENGKERTVLSGGSAVLLGLEAVDDQHFGWFVTCYHVLHSASEFKIEYVAGGERKTVTSSDSAELYDRNKSDLVIIRAPVRKDLLDKLTPVFPAGQDKTDASFRWSHEEHGDSSVEGIAIGYSWLDRGIQHSVAVKLWGHQTLNTLVTPEGQRIMKIWDARNPGYATFLGNEITMPGMSGGLVVTSEEASRFAGLIFARIGGVQGLAVSADTVLNTWSEAEAEAKAGHLQSFSREDLREPLPFNDNLRVTGIHEFGESRMEWESLDQWSLAFRNDRDQAIAFRQFLEVNVDFRSLDVENEVVSIHVPEIAQTERDLDRDDSESYEFLLNGNVVNAGEPLMLHPGENLLVMNKKRKRQGLAVNDFLHGGNELDVTIKVGNKDRFVVKRSLPTVIESYSVYVTILVDGESIVRWPGVLQPDPLSSSRAWGQFGQLPPEIRRLVEHVRIEWAVREIDLRTGSRIAGHLIFDELATAKFRRISDQTLDLRIPIEVQMEEVAIRFVGLRIAWPGNSTDAHESIKIWLDLRLQVCANSDGKPTVTVRALTAASESPLTIPLLQGQDGGLNFDVSSLISHLTVAYVNRHVLKPSTEDLSSEEFLMLALGGVSDDPLERLIPAMLGFRKDKAVGQTEFKIAELTCEVTEARDYTANLRAKLKLRDAQLPNGILIENATLDVQAKLHSGEQDGHIGELAFSFDDPESKIYGKDGTRIPTGERPIPIKIAAGGKLIWDEETLERSLDWLVPGPVKK